MLRRQIGFRFSVVLLSIAVTIASCHNSTGKVTVPDSRAKKDSLKAVEKTETHKGPFPTFVILDTVVGSDTMKFTMYGDSLVKCSINRLSDTSNCGGHFEHWDSSFGDYGLIIVPDKMKLQKFILNDSILIVPVSYGFMRMSGGVALFLLNRTKYSLKFAPVNTDNPCRIGSECPYVDIKSNQIIDYYYHAIYNDEDYGNGGDEHGRYMTFRSRIKNKQFVQADEIAASSKEIEKLELFDPGNSDLIAYYTLLAHHEDWNRDRYDSSNIQRITAIDTLIGEAKIKVWYDNNGNVVCRLNGKCDSTDWDEQWMGYEWWMKKDAHRIIVPGEKKPKAFILNDSLLLFTLVNNDNRAVLFIFDRKKTNLDSTQINTFANYIYVDLKKNVILSYEDSDERVDLRDNAEVFPHPKGAPWGLGKYKIQNRVFVDVGNDLCYCKGENPQVLNSPEDFKWFYNCGLHSKDSIFSDKSK